MTVENPSLDGEHIPLTDQTTNKKTRHQTTHSFTKADSDINASKFNLLFVLQIYRISNRSKLDDTFIFAHAVHNTRKIWMNYH